MNLQELDQKTEAVFQVLADRGLRVDRAVFADLEAEYTAEYRALTQDLGFEMTPTKIATYLQSKGYILPKTPKGQPRTGADVLQYLEPKIPEIDKIIQANSIKSLLSLASSLLEKAEKGRGQLYPVYHMDPELGRVHAGEVNYLNWAEPFKKALRPSPGFKLAKADYKQFDLRVVAMLSGDEALQEALESADMLKAVASRAFKVPLEQVTEEIRSAAKEIAYGILYGKTPHGVSRTLRIPLEEAERFCEDFFTAYPKLAHFLEQTKTIAKRTKKTETYFGRSRDLTELMCKDYGKALRLAVSHRVQSTSGDLMRLSLIKLHSKETELGFRVLGQIHDEFMIEVPEAWTDPQVQALFEAALVHPKLPFKLKFSFEVL